MSERTPAVLAFTSFERALLRAADADEAPPGALARAQLALGAGAQPATATPANGTSAPTNAAWSLWQKPLLLGVLGGVGLVVSARVIEAPSRASTPPPVTARSLGAAPEPTPVTPIATPRRAEPAPSSPPRQPRLLNVHVPAPASQHDDAPLEPKSAPNPPWPEPVPMQPALETPPPPRVSTTEAGNFPVPRSPSIAEEVIQVDRARNALRDGQVREALEELARYRKRWPLGVLTPEVTVLQIEAELRLGARESARRRARELVTAQPNSRYAARLRTLFQPSELQ